LYIRDEKGEPPPEEPSPGDEEPPGSH
jgi:hypothetical protein